jgi:hypothetical protein
MRGGRELILRCRRRGMNRAGRGEGGTVFF